MTRGEYIEAVRVKLEEISPFDDPSWFIADTANEANKVKPIREYIDATLNEATKEMLLLLPPSLIWADTDVFNLTTPNNSYYYLEGDPAEQMHVGKLALEQAVGPTYVRILYVKVGAWLRPVTELITDQDKRYQLQCNPYTRGGVAKPVVVYLTQPRYMLELYSIPAAADADKSITMRYMDVGRRPEMLASDIGEYIVLNCAAKVFVIMERPELAKHCMDELTAKLELILK